MKNQEIAVEATITIIMAIPLLLSIRIFNS